MVLGYEKGQRQHSARDITRGKDPLPIDDLTLEHLSITEAILCFIINNLLQHKAIYKIFRGKNPIRQKTKMLTTLSFEE